METAPVHKFSNLNLLSESDPVETDGVASLLDLSFVGMGVCVQVVQLLTWGVR